MIVTFGSAKYHFALFSVILLTNIFIYFNTPILRPVFGFLFLTLLPGLLIINLLRQNKLKFIDKLILSWGLSIAFIMFFGLIINNILINLGFMTPLSLKPILISLDISYIILIIINYKIYGDSVFNFNFPRLNSAEKLLFMVVIIFPFLCVYGVQLINSGNSNIFVLLLLSLISAIIIITSLLEWNFSSYTYPPMIFLISLSLLLLLSFRSNYVVGWDAQSEYLYFIDTLNNSQWSILDIKALDSCLSISILPVIYKQILGLPPLLLFKLLYASLYSIAPLIIYSISIKYTNIIYAFLASCFFMFQPAFLWTEANARTNLAVLFVALSIMVIFSNEINTSTKRFLFINFFIACVFSHYATTYIYYGIIVTYFILKYCITRIKQGLDLEKVININMCTLFSAIFFIWYSQITDVPFRAGVTFLFDSVKSLNRIFLSEFKGAPAQSLLGEGFTRGVPFIIQFAFTWLTFGLIAIGIIVSLIKFLLITFSDFKMDYLKDDPAELNWDYLLLGLICSGISALMIVIPFLSMGYGIERAYSLLLIILSIYFVLGGRYIGDYLHKKLKLDWMSHKSLELVIILGILIPYFLSISGVTQVIFGYPYQIVLSSNGDQYDMMYIHDQEWNSGNWLKKAMESESNVYTDNDFRLTSLGLKAVYNSELAKDKIAPRDGYLFLRYTNIINGKFLAKVLYASQWIPMNNEGLIIPQNNKIYNSGYSEIWRYGS